MYKPKNNSASKKLTKKNNNSQRLLRSIENDDEIETIEGKVIDALPDAHFRVDTKAGDKIAYLGGRMRVNKIRILVGDKVTLQLDEYGGKSRVIRRH